MGYLAISLASLGRVNDDPNPSDLSFMLIGRINLERMPEAVGLRLKLDFGAKALCPRFVFHARRLWQGSQQLCRQGRALGLWQFHGQFLNLAKTSHAELYLTARCDEK
jgi:hypothetical protein